MLLKYNNSEIIKNVHNLPHRYIVLGVSICPCMYKCIYRLSEVAGAKLTESNPYITDLSDPNRPEKIGEQFSELYDNLWTDIFEKLSGTCKLSERDSIQTLLQILEVRMLTLLSDNPQKTLNQKVKLWIFAN